jgi:hypothetical protein
MKKIILDALKIRGFAENEKLLIEMLYIAYKMGAVNQVCAIGAENIKSIETPEVFKQRLLNEFNS